MNNPTANSWYYYHYNAHGDVTVVTDANGNIFREYLYDPYGNNLSVKDQNGNEIADLDADSFNHVYTYAGYRYDTETGLYYLNARYYEAGIGRFLTKDAFKGSVERTKSLNRYAYAQGDPVNFVDLTGYNPVSLALIGALSAVSIASQIGDIRVNETKNQGVSGNLAKNAVASGADATFGYYLKGLAEETVSIEGNGAIRTYTPRYGVKALKGLSRYAGPAAIGALTYDLYGDYRDYRNSSMDYAMGYAMGLTAVGTAAGVAAGVALSVLGAPVIAGVIGAVGIGFLGSMGAGYLKEQLLTR